MSKVIALQEYRERRLSQTELDVGEHPRRIPRVSDADVWTRNYNNFPDIIYGVLRVREILDYHFHYCEEWKYHLLCLIEHAYFKDREEHAARLLETCDLLKSYLAEEMTVLNRKEVSVALVILDLIQKNNVVRKTLSQ